MLVSSVFSMQPGSLPFTQNFSAFTFSLLVVITTTVVLVIFLEPIWKRVKAASKVTEFLWGGVRVVLGALGRSQEPLKDTESLSA